jgi:hypothetical protein
MNGNRHQLDVCVGMQLLFTIMFLVCRAHAACFVQRKVLLLAKATAADLTWIFAYHAADAQPQRCSTPSSPLRGTAFYFAVLGRSPYFVTGHLHKPSRVDDEYRIAAIFAPYGYRPIDLHDGSPCAGQGYPYALSLSKPDGSCIPERRSTSEASRGTPFRDAWGLSLW